MLPEIAIAAWIALIVATVIAGISKTALPGAATIPVAIFASLLIDFNVQGINGLLRHEISPPAFGRSTAAAA